MAELPTGTVTFLFTDIEGSTRLWEDHQDAMKDALARHDVILREAVEIHDGVVFSTMGDGVAAAFASAPDAVNAALDAQQRLGSEAWGATGPLRVRMGLHTDEGRLRAPGEYVNRPLNRCARLMAVGHGGQVLLSDSTTTVARDGLPSEVGLVDLGEHRLRDLGAPMRVFQLAHPGLATDFPAVAVVGRAPRQSAAAGDDVRRARGRHREPGRLPARPLARHAHRRRWGGKDASRAPDRRRARARLPRRRVAVRARAGERPRGDLGHVGREPGCPSVAGSQPRRFGVGVSGTEAAVVRARQL